MTALRVAVADDSVLLREGLVRVLEDAGLEVVGAFGDAEALLGAMPGLEPDAVVLDMQLATGSGLAVLRHLRRSGPAPLIIVLTNHLHVQYRRACMAEGADHFLDKSTEFAAVAEILGRAATR